MDKVQEESVTERIFSATPRHADDVVERFSIRIKLSKRVLVVQEYRMPNLLKSTFLIFAYLTFS